jgi:hypothetical protein
MAPRKRPGQRWDASRLRPQDLSLVVPGLTVVVSLVTYAYRGWFSRYTADDYCTAGLERAAGFVGAQVYWYQFWSGRVTYYFVVGMVEYAGPWVVQVLPAIALSAWLGIGAWALYPLARRHHWRVPPVSATLVSAAIILVCLSGAPRLDQSLYWQTGMLTYLLPVVLMTAYAGWLARRALTAGSLPVSRREILGSGAFLLAVGGLSEVSLGVQLTLLGLGAGLAQILLRSTRPQAVRTLLTTGLLATIISAVIVVAAPGNYIHEQTVSGSVHDLSQLPLAFDASVDFVGLFARSVEFRARPAVLLLLVLMLGWGFQARASASTPFRGRSWLWYAAAILGVVACAWLVLIAASVPGYFAQQWDVPERAQFVGVWVVALTLAWLGYLIGQAAGDAVRRLDVPVNTRLAWAAWCVLLVVGAAAPVPAIRDTLALARVDAGYAAEWDALDATVRAEAGDGEPVVLQHSLPMHYGFDFLGSDPTLYPNPCVARFYGVPSIKVAE